MFCIFDFHTLRLNLGAFVSELHCPPVRTLPSHEGRQSHTSSQLVDHHYPEPEASVCTPRLADEVCADERGSLPSINRNMKAATKATPAVTLNTAG